MPPEQPRRGKIEQAALILIDQPTVFHIDVPVLAGRVQGAAHLLRPLLDHGLRLRQLLRGDHRHAALDNPRFLAGNLHRESPRNSM